MMQRLVDTERNMYVQLAYVQKYYSHTHAHTHLLINIQY